MTRLMMRAQKATRPPTLRRSASVVGEVRIYQELIRLAVMRQRLLSQQARGSQEAKKEMEAIDKYRDDLYTRLGLCRVGLAAAKKAPRVPAAEAPNGAKAEESATAGIAGVQQLRYCRDK